MLACFKKSVHHLKNAVDSSDQVVLGHQRAACPFDYAKLAALDLIPLNFLAKPYG